MLSHLTISSSPLRQLTIALLMIGQQTEVSPVGIEVQLATNDVIDRAQGMVGIDDLHE